MPKTRILAAIITALAATTAGAQTDEPLLAQTRDNWPTELTRRPLTLAQGMVELYVPANINLSDGQEWEPVSFAPSLYFGITDRWMIGVRHAFGVCPGGTDNNCPDFYNDASVDTVLSLGRTSGLDFALGLAVNVGPIDPEAFSGEARVIVRAGGGSVALTVAPTVNFGLNERDANAFGVGRTKYAPYGFNFGTYNAVNPEVFSQNQEALLVPATLQLQLGSNLALVAGASLNGPLNFDQIDFSDDYRVPVMGALVITPIPWIDLGASLTFPDLLGKNDDSDFRSLGIFAAFRI